MRAPRYFAGSALPACAREVENSDSFCIQSFPDSSCRTFTIPFCSIRFRSRMLISFQAGRSASGFDWQQSLNSFPCPHPHTSPRRKGLSGTFLTKNSRFPRTQHAIGEALPVVDAAILVDNSREERHAFTVCRVHLVNEKIYDWRDDGAGPPAAILNWLDRVAAPAPAA
jgi:hypothetical protein